MEVRRADRERERERERGEKVVTGTFLYHPF
jgi:hypothetical protein